MRRPSPLPLVFAVSRSRAGAPPSLLVLLVVLALALALLPVLPSPAWGASFADPAPHGDTRATEIPEVWPNPQSVESRDGALTLHRRAVLVASEDTDRAALRVVEETLRGAGVTRIDRVHPGEPGPRRPLAVYVGGPQVNAATGEALRALDVPGPGDLPAEGYVLAAGEAQSNRQVIALAGADAAGTFYAAQTFRQLVVSGRGPAEIHAVEVRDWPSMRLRGVIEGFYGQPWSHQDRLSQLDFYGRTKQNIYVYSPKDDPYLRERWREPYPADRIAKIEELVDRARANHVAFTYALSPGLSICYSSEDDLRAVVEKFESMWDIGVRSFAIPLDDISYTDWNCDADEAKFGTGPRAAGEAQAHILNRVQQEFIEPHRDEGVARLQMVPTEYYDVEESPYKKALRTYLSDEVIVEWTGIGVIAPVITTEQAKAAKQVFGHDILVWDNYPVNDYVQDRLLLGPYVGREPGIAEHLVGVTANPMVQAEASKVAEFTSADFLWNPDAYQPERSWRAALRMIGGDAWRWLEVLAENSYSSRLQDVESPVLAPRIERFWAAYESGDGLDEATRKLSDYFTTMAATPGRLREELDNRALADEIQPWASKLGHYGEAGRHALRMLQAIRSGDDEAAWRHRQALGDALDAAHATWVPASDVEPRVAPGVFSPFARRALDVAAEWFGIDRVRPETSMGTYGDNVAANMVDGNPDSFYWSDGAPSAGDHIGVDLSRTREVTRVEVLMGKPDSPDDYIHEGVLEVSVDGEEWTAIGEFSGRPEISATAPDGTRARYVRLRATSGQQNWVVVRELSVTTPGGIELTAAGKPPAAGESSLANAVDGNLDTSYVAAREPHPGEALTVSFDNPVNLSGVTVLQATQQPVPATVQVRTGGGWSNVGQLDGGHTRLDIGGSGTSEAVRVLWPGDSPPPRIAEVAPESGSG